MEDYKLILKMIEEVDPSDEKKLNEIDAHTYAYLKLYDNFKVSIHKGGGSITYRHNSWGDRDHSVLYHLFDGHRYTRSRDALKEIRPEGWVDFAIFSDTQGRSFSAELGSCKSPHLPTEELAELHAIVQAIAWEREHG